MAQPILLFKKNRSRVRALKALFAALLIVSVDLWSGIGVVQRASANGEWLQAGAIPFGNFIPPTTDPYRYNEARSVSCPSPGNCAAVGEFQTSDGRVEAFLAMSVNGVWSPATKVTFASGVEHSSPTSVLYSVSCPTAGNCVAAGRFKNAAGGFEGFTVSSSGGTWSTATPVAFTDGVQRANPNRNTTLFSVSCGTVGNCAGVGYFVNASGFYEAFVVSSSGGTWSTATPVVFPGGQNATPDGYLYTVSCGAAGDCTGGGYFENTAGIYKAFTITQSGGSWGDGRAVEFAPGVRSVSSPFDYLESISCPSAGNCTAAGFFENASDRTQAFTVNLSGGTWANAVPTVFDSSVIQSANPVSRLRAISCASAGNCAAVGQVRNVNGDDEVFTAISTGGVWGNAKTITFGIGIQNAAPSDRPYSVSCASAGNCSAVGIFRNATFGYEAFTISSYSGIWGIAAPVTFDSGIQNAAPDARANSVSCASAGNCSAVGYFKNSDGTYDALAVMSESDSSSSTTLAPSTASDSPTTTTSPGLAPVKSVYDSAVPGVTVTDPRVYTTLPSEVAKNSAIVALSSTDVKTMTLRSRTLSTCLVADDNVVFLNEGVCRVDVVNTKTGKVVRSLTTRIGSAEIRKLRVGNPVLLLSTVYFDKMSARLDPKSTNQIRRFKPAVSSAGTTLVIGHSGTVFGKISANFALSWSRANAVVEALKAHGVVGPLVARGVGPRQPASRGITDLEQSKNHRAVIALIP